MKPRKRRAVQREAKWLLARRRSNRDLLLMWLWNHRVRYRVHQMPPLRFMIWMRELYARGG